MLALYKMITLIRISFECELNSFVVIDFVYIFALSPLLSELEHNGMCIEREDVELTIPERPDEALSVEYKLPSPSDK